MRGLCSLSVHRNPEPHQGNLKNVTARFPEIAESLKGCPFKTIILDAEVVAVDGATRLHELVRRCMLLPKTFCGFQRLPGESAEGRGY